MLKCDLNSGKCDSGCGGGIVISYFIFVLCFEVVLKVKYGINVLVLVDYFQNRVRVHARTHAHASTHGVLLSATVQ